MVQIPCAARSQQTLTLAELTARGALIMPLPRDSQVATGSLCRDFQKISGDAIMPLRARTEFSHQQSILALVMTWDADGIFTRFKPGTKKTCSVGLGQGRSLAQSMVEQYVPRASTRCVS
jgi:hypothetical protein